MKRCSGCKETKTLSEFSRAKGYKDGIYSWCRACHAKATKKWAKENVERKRELSRRFYALNREKVRAQSKARYDPKAAAIKRKKWYEANKSRMPQHNRQHNLKRYGLTEESYEALLVSQGGGCAICKTTRFGHKRLHVDHCHTTNIVRGILCGNCNLGIGNLGDSPQRLLDAAQYLERFAKSRGV